MTVRLAIPSSRLLVAFMGMVTLALALWQGADSFLRLYGETDPDLSKIDDTLARAALDNDAAFLEMIDDWLGDPQAKIRAGILQLRLSFPASPTAVPDRRKLVKAIDDLSDGLARAPADARAWTALAHARMAEGDGYGARLALRTAFMTAFYNPDLTIWRVQLGLILWPILTEEDQRMVANQLRIAWVQQPAELVGLARGSNTMAIVAAALAQDPAQRSAFENAMKRQGGS